MQVQCPRCRTVVDTRGLRSMACPECGFSLARPRAAAPAGDFVPVAPAETPFRPTHPAPRPRRPPLTRERIAFGLALNVLVPGTGTLYTGRRAEGGAQLATLLLGLATIPLLVGLALVPAAWVWALVSSIQHLLDYDRRLRSHRH